MKLVTPPLPYPEPIEEIECLTLESVKRLHIIKVVLMCNGNIAQAARVLKVRRTTLGEYVQRIKRTVGPLEQLFPNQ